MDTTFWEDATSWATLVRDALATERLVNQILDDAVASGVLTTQQREAIRIEVAVQREPESTT